MLDGQDHIFLCIVTRVEPTVGVFEYTYSGHLCETMSFYGQF